MKTLSGLLLIPILAGCATGRLSVETSPRQAEIFVKDTNGTGAKSLGSSPLNKSLAEVRALANGRTVVLEARKDGFITRSVVISDLDSSSDIKLSFDLTDLQSLLKDKPDSEKTPEEKAFQEAMLQSALDAARKKAVSELTEKHILETNQIVDQLFEAQRLAQVGRLEDANRRLDDLQKRFPTVAAIYEMQGGIAFMQSDYNKALDSYTTAAKNNPASLELLNMRNYLQKKLNLGPRAPAGETR